jgi:hypothetical protein
MLPRPLPRHGSSLLAVVRLMRLVEALKIQQIVRHYTWDRQQEAFMELWKTQTLHPPRRRLHHN